jgi:hypothetical protein
MSSSHHNGSNGTEPRTFDVPDHGFMTFGTSALLALNDELIGKRKGNGERFTDVIPKLAEEGFKIVLAQRVVEAVRSALSERGQGGYDAPILELLDSAERGALFNVQVEPSDTRHDSYEATKALISKYAGTGKPVYAVTNSTKPVGGRRGLIMEIADAHPDVVLVTTTALLHDLHVSGLAQRFGLDSDHLKTISTLGREHQRGTKAADTLPIDSTGHAMRRLESIDTARLRHGLGELGDVLKHIVKTTKPVARDPSAHKHRPAGSHLALTGVPGETYTADAAERDLAGNTLKI